MRADIHPKYQTVKVNCSCGNSFETGSAICRDIHLDVCSKCHPFYSGQHKLVDTEGRVDGFRKKFAQFSTLAGKDKKKS